MKRILTSVMISAFILSCASVTQAEEISASKVEVTQNAASAPVNSSGSVVTPNAVWDEKYEIVHRMYNSMSEIPSSIYYVDPQGYRGQLDYKQTQIYSDKYYVAAFAGWIGKYID